MEHVFDSVCRCFGGVPAVSTSSQGRTSDKESPEIKRRTSRLELQDKEWDGLFQHESPSRSPKQQQQQQQANEPQHPVDLDYARAVAQAKLAANPPPRRSQQKRRKKRKSPATMRDEIFRTRRNERPPSSSTTPEESQGNFAKFLNTNPGVANALCFANPIRESDDDVPLNAEPDDDSTLNTCEDTITSTIYFESKYSHIKEKRPPMPLFSHFKVDPSEEDHIRRIVATDSHNSLKMISLMNQQQPKQQLHHPSSSSEEETPPPPPKPPQRQHPEILRHHIPRRRPSPSVPPEPAPEPVKTDSSGSSKSTASTAPSSSSPNDFSEEGRVVHL